MVDRVQLAPRPAAVNGDLEVGQQRHLFGLHCHPENSATSTNGSIDISDNGASSGSNDP